MRKRGRWRKKGGGGDSERRGGKLENKRETGVDSLPLQRCKDGVNISGTQTDQSSQQSHALHLDNHVNHCTGLTAVNRREKIIRITCYRRDYKPIRDLRGVIPTYGWLEVAIQREIGNNTPACVHVCVL